MKRIRHQAILAKASMSNDKYRPGFDISLPLFHKTFPETAGKQGMVTTNNFPVKNKHFLAFKVTKVNQGLTHSILTVKQIFSRIFYTFLLYFFIFKTWTWMLCQINMFYIKKH